MKVRNFGKQQQKHFEIFRLRKTVELESLSLISVQYVFIEIDKNFHIIIFYF